MVAGLRSLLMSIRPPRARKTLPMADAGLRSAQLTLASGNTPAGAVESLAATAVLPGDGAVLVVPSVAIRPGQGAHPQVVSSLLAHLGPAAEVGIPHGTPKPLRGRWERLAHNSGCDVVHLGSAGWDQVRLEGDGYLLDRVYLPAELHGFERRILVPALRDEALALGFLRAIAHPHTRLRTRGSAVRGRLDAEVAATLACSFVLDASRIPGLVATNLIAWADDPVSAELIGVGIQRYIDTARGFESVTAWEHGRVQAATELGIGPPAGEALLLNVRTLDNVSRALTEFLAAELSCKIAWLEDGVTDAT